ncbi:MAG: hypothetical protein FJ319_00525 [SAR202 cluster bacterium]|nr:hypothetical protein [SAR202 cluster bacterium]
MSNADIRVSSTCFSAYGTTSAYCQDDNGHGTHVAGIAAAMNNTTGVVGVAPGATVYSVRVLHKGSGADSAVIAGLDWVLANENKVTPRIRVANMSLGRLASSDDSAMQAAVAAVNAAGITVVVAAGNDAALEANAQVPAKFAEAIAVGSTTAEAGTPGKGACNGAIAADTASLFTSDGTAVAISAPGETKEDLKGCTITADGILSLARGGGTVKMYGTSMAAPHVAGAIALMWDRADDKGGSLSPAQVRTAITATASRKGTAPLNSPTGGYSFDGVREGILNVPAALAY